MEAIELAKAIRAKFAAAAEGARAWDDLGFAERSVAVEDARWRLDNLLPDPADPAALAHVEDQAAGVLLRDHVPPAAPAAVPADPIPAPAPEHE